MLASHPRLFAAAKMPLTGGGVLVLVALARARVFRIIRVSSIMHWFLLGYAALIGYEWCAPSVPGVVVARPDGPRLNLPIV